MSSTIAKLLDLRGMSCPMPIALTAKAIRDLSVGDLIEVHATDPGSVQDMPAWCSTTGPALVEQTEADGVYRFVIRKVR
jgi:TusA-related sulfurtransferase